MFVLVFIQMYYLNYKKYDNILYSPLVLFAVQDVADYPDGFIKVPTSSSAFRVDLYTILSDHFCYI